MCVSVVSFLIYALVNGDIRYVISAEPILANSNIQISINGDIRSFILVKSVFSYDIYS